MAASLAYTWSSLTDDERTCLAQLSWVVLDQVLPADPCALPETPMFATGVVCGLVSRVLLLSAALAPSEGKRSDTLRS